MGLSVDLTVKTVKNISGSSTSRTNNNGENREEGEIVDDDFEDIISSDEELSMRKRIEELEARNSELEKLANISGFYYDVGCANDRLKPGLHANVINISDTEDCSYTSSVVYPKKKPRKQVSELPSKRPIQHLKPHAPTAYKQGKKRSDPLEAVDSPLRESHRTKKRKYEKHVRPRGKNSRKKEHTKSRKKPADCTYSSDEELCSLDRNELRRALRYDPALANVVSRTNDEVKRSSSHKIEEPKIECETIEINDYSDKQADSDDSESLELKELRLIALKSVFLERGRKRKQRKQLEAKKPYSPTDCLVPIIPVDSDITSPDEFSDHEPSKNMDISPIASPETVGDDSLSKPVDMDLVESSNSMSPEFLPSQTWAPIHPVSMTGHFPNSRNSEADYRFGTQMYTHRIISPTVIRAKPPSVTFECTTHIPIETDEDEEVEIKNEEVASPEPLDEEVLALRTLLLAQKNSPKYSKNITAVPEPPPVPEAKPAEKQIERDPMVTILDIAQGPPSKTAEILKEAVKRLQNQSTKEEIAENLSDIHSMKSNIVKEHLSMKPSNVQQSDVFENQHSGLCPIISPASQLPQAPPRPIEVVGNVQIPNLTATAAAAKHVKVKENMYATQGTRPNIIEIVPTNILPKIVRKSPLSDITETDNVTVKKPDINTKPKTNKSTIEDCTGAYANSSDSASVADKVKPIVSEVPETSNKEQVEIQRSKSLTQLKATLTAAAASLSTPKRQRKKSTTLEALQLKTQNLVSNGRYIISRNKLIANKLLNKAIHNSSAPVKPKPIVAHQNPLADDARLIKTVAVPTVKRLVINVGSKSESESESDTSLEAPDHVSHISVKPSPAVGELYDVASPMSLPMESPRDSPLTVAVPSEITNDVPTTISAGANITDCANAIGPVPGQSMDVKNNDPAVKDDISTTSTKASGETLEAKVEKFLKNVRSQVDSLKKEITVNQTAKQIVMNKAKNTSTPAAVKHLPLSSQLEYRRLVNRMQALEKQKQSRCKPAVTSNDATLKVTISHDIKDPIAKPQTTEPGMPVASTVSPATIDVSPAEDASNTVKSIAQIDQNELTDNLQAIKCENETINNETALSVKKEPAESLKHELVEPPNESNLGKKPLPKATEIQSEPKVLQTPKKVLKPVATLSAAVKPKTIKSVTVSKPSVTVKKNPATNTTKTSQVPKPAVTPIKPNTPKVSKLAPKTPKPPNSTNKNLPATKKIITKARATKTTQVTNKSPAITTKPAKVLKKIVPATKNKSLPLSVEECQAQYIQSSTNLVDNITKTIQLVIQVQNEKRERSLLQQELSQLRQRMLEVENKIKAKDLAMSAVVPKISSSHKIIVALKERTSHLEELSVDLCKRTGDERNNLYMEQKNKVIKLSKELSVEIKNWKSMETPNEVGAKTGQHVSMASTSDTEICRQTIKVNSSNADKGRKPGINTSTQNSVTAGCTTASDIVGTGSVSGSVDNRNSNSPSVSTNSSGVKLSKTGNVKANQTKVESKQTTNKCDKRNVQSIVDRVETEGETDKTGNGSEADEIGPSASKRRKTSCESVPETLYFKIRNESGSEDPDATKLAMKEKKILPHSEYVSPLDHSNEFDRCIDPTGIVCPYQLTGLCHDKDCKFIHLETQQQ